MFIGHFAVALAAKRAAPRASLGTLVLAAQFLDILWPVLLLAGIERVEIRPGDTAFTPLAFEHYPISHSLAATLAWAAIFAGLYGWARRDRAGAMIVAAVVVSHWLLDWITHRPDLPLYPGGPLEGLGLWNSVAATLVVEVAMFAAGLAVYLRATRARDALGRWNAWAFAAFLVLAYLAAAFGPPPPDPRTLAWSTFGVWLLVAWAWWVDRHRTPAGTA
jgi:LexA-binding, inner membrane-associated putative hydrolase